MPEGRASGQGRVFQSSGDQYIAEHHHHYPAGDGASLFEPDSGRVIVRARTSGGQLRWPGPDSVRMPLAGHAPLVLRDRTSLMEDLAAAVESASGGVRVLHGLGGSGKTAVAQALFHRVMREGRQVALWVNAGERGSLRAGMLAVAADRGAETGELAAAYDGQRAAADLVWRYLHASPQRWVLVLDNADDPTVLGDGSWLRASSQGLVVVTTRQAHSDVWRGATLHKVDVLPLPDAAQVLCDLAPQAGTLQEAETVARRLECLPLALTLAGSFLSRQLLEPWSMSEYERRLDEDPTGLIDRGASPGGRDGQARQLVGQTWSISLDALTQRGVPESRTLLRLLSCWSSSPVPLPMVLPAAVEATELGAAVPALAGSNVEPALRGLLDHSLISLVEVEPGERTERCIQAHGVLLDSVAAAIPAESRAVIVRSAARLLDGAIPEAEVPAEAASRIRQLVPHALALLKRAVAASVHQPVDVAIRLAEHTYETGEFQSALALSRAAADAAGKLHETDARSALRARHREAAVLFRMGLFEESESVHRHVLNEREELLGPDHPETLESYQDIHGPLGQLGRLRECLDTLHRVVEARTRVLGPMHPDTLRTQALRIEYMVQECSAEEFMRMGSGVVSACEQSLGPDAVTTVIARHNYAYGLYSLGRTDEAEPVARQALADRERVHGPHHALALSAAVLLSWILERLGNLPEAIGLGRRVVRGQEGSLGPEHPYLLINRTGLASMLASAGEVEEARSLARLNLPLCERVLGPEDTVTVRTRTLLAEA